jgi:hypothetical protein
MVGVAMASIAAESLAQRNKFIEPRIKPNQTGES